jgi:hypothetical protein
LSPGFVRIVGDLVQLLGIVENIQRQPQSTRPQPHTLQLADIVLAEQRYRDGTAAVGMNLGLSNAYVYLGGCWHGSPIGHNLLCVPLVGWVAGLAAGVDTC